MKGKRQGGRGMMKNEAEIKYEIEQENKKQTR